MAKDRLENIVGSRSQYRTPSGLIAVFDKPLKPAAGQTWTSSPLGIAFPANPSPSLLEQMVVVCDEAALGLEPPTTIEEVRELVRPLPYPPAFVVVARIARALWPIRDDPAQQLALAGEIFGDSEIMQLFADFLAHSDGGEKRYLFHEQQLFVLQRLILESGGEEEEKPTWSKERGVELNKALIGVTSIIGEGAARIRREGRQLEDWLGFFAQNGAYNASEQPLLAYQRAWRVFVELPTTEEARAHPAYCPLDDWSRAHSSASLRELFAVGFGAAQAAQKEDAPPEERAIVAPMERYLSTTSLAPRHAVFTEALSAHRSFYIEGFARSRDNPLRMAWETTPFLAKPFLQLPDGHLALSSPRAAQSWLTDGMYYRLLDIAAAEGRRDDYTTFVGWLVERYVREVFELALGPAEPGYGRVHGDREYKGQKTSDVAVDYGEDLVLVEVISTRLPLGVRAEADEDDLTRFLQRTVTDKLEQLDRVVNDLTEGRARLPDVDMGGVQRVWPVLVTYGDVFPTEPLWAYINREAGGLLQQGVAQRLTLLGIEDVETLAGMVACGEGLIDCLSEKAGGTYRELPWSRWVLDMRDEPPPRLPALEQRWFTLTDELIELLELGS